jgi:hypothetical protein
MTAVTYILEVLHIAEQPELWETSGGVTPGGKPLVCR